MTISEKFQFLYSLGAKGGTLVSLENVFVYDEMQIHQGLTVVSMILRVTRKVEERQMQLYFGEKCILYRLMELNTAPQLWHCLQKLLNL